jgi:hypothetical protein
MVMAKGHDRIGRACYISLIAFAALAISIPAFAQSLDDGANASAEHHPTTIVGGQQTSAPIIERCVEVEIGKDSAFGCLNQKLKREVDRVNPLMNLPPIDARSPDVRVGNVNEAAVRQQYGSNYGRSAIPFRPPVPTFGVPRR